MTIESSPPPVTTSSDCTVLALFPPILPEAKRLTEFADYGVSLRIHDQAENGATVIFGPYLNQEPNETVWLNCNSELGIYSVQTKSHDDAVTLFIPHGKLLADLINTLTCTVERNSGNKETSEPPLRLLYNKIRPGFKDAYPDIDGHSELKLLLPDEIRNGVGPDFVSASICVNYPYCRANDRIRLKCNGVEVFRDVTAQEGAVPPDPGSITPTQVCFVVIREFLESAINVYHTLSFSYSVTDYCGNPPDLDAIWSASQTVDEDLAGARLPAPILREIQNDPTDDPGIIDLEKLGTNPLLLIVLTNDPRFETGNSISATYTAKVVGQPDVVVTVSGDVETDEFGQKKPCVLQVANDKVIAGSVVTVTYQLLKNGTPAGTSKVATARVVGESTIELSPPTLPSTPNPFDPLNYPQGVSVRVDHAAAVPGDKARLFLLNPLPESPAFVDLPLDQKFALFTLDPTFLGLWHGKVPQLAWKLIKGEQPVAESAPLVLTVNRIANDDPRLSKPTIDGATGDGVLDVAQMQDSAQLRVAAWLLQVSGHGVWLRYDGFDKAGLATELVVWAGAAHSSTSGLVTAAAIAWLRTLKDDSTLALTFGVNFEKKADAATMVRFPVQVYTIKAVADVKPAITLATDSKGIEIIHGHTSADRYVTLEGTASKGQSIQIRDGGTAIGLPVDVNLDNGIWRSPLPGLSDGFHSFTAKALYGTGLISEARTLTIRPVITQENFDTQPSLTLNPGGSRDIGSMAITNSGSGRILIGPIFRPHPGKVEKQTLVIDGENNVLKLSLKLPCSEVSFWYTDVNKPTRVAFYGLESKLGEVDLLSSEPLQSYQLIFKGEGIVRIEILCLLSDVIYFDNFIFKG